MNERIHCVEHFNTSLDQAEESMKSKKDHLTLPSEGNKKKKKDENKENIWDLWDTIKRNNLHITGVSQGGETEEVESLFKYH